MKLKALIGEEEYAIEKEVLSQLRALSAPKVDYHILHENKNFEVRVLSIDLSTKLVSVEVNGRLYEVKLQDDLDRSIGKMGFKRSSDKVDNTILAPMPGLVLDMFVEERQKVEKGEALLILEAMKMENVIKAEKDGVISFIAVQKGDAVEKKALLIEMEL